MYLVKEVVIQFIMKMQLKDFEKYCKNPELLEVKPEKIVSDPGIKSKK